MYIIGRHSTVRKLRILYYVTPTLKVRTVAMLELLIVVIFGGMMFVSCLMKIRQGVRRSLREGQTQSPGDGLNIDFITKLGN